MVVHTQSSLTNGLKEIEVTKKVAFKKKACPLSISNLYNYKVRDG